MAAIPAGSVRYVATVAHSILIQSLTAHIGIASLVISHTAVALVISYSLDRAVNFQMLERGGVLALVILPIFIPCLLVYEFVRMATCDRPESPLQHFAGRIIRCIGDIRRMVDGTVLLFLFIVFLASFSFIKDSIPLLNPFSWDRTFFEIDRQIFMGVDPWRISFAVFGSPVGTTILNFFYNVWFFIMYGIVFATAFQRASSETRYAFFYAFFLIWSLGGNLLAALFSSAGPVYFSRLGLGAEYVLQFALLHEYTQVLPVWSLHIQDELWKSYVNGSGTVSGISAMPSMHVASSVLFAIFGFRVHHVLGIVMTIFAVLIVIGSVHLGWHYFVDGILGTAVTFACWHAALLLARVDLKWQRGALPYR